MNQIRQHITIDELPIHDVALNELQTFVERTCEDREPSHNDVHMRTVRDNGLRILGIMIWIRVIMMFCLSIGLYVSWIQDNPMLLIGWIIISTIVVVKMRNNIRIPFLSFRELPVLRFMVQVVAWLHDVADHKYTEEDPTLDARLDQFLINFTHKYKHTVESTPYQNLFTSHGIRAIIERVSFSRQVAHGTDDWYPVLGYYGCLIRDIVSDADKWEALGKKGIDRCVAYTIEQMDKKNEIVTKHTVYQRVAIHYHEKLKRLSSREFMKTFPGWLGAGWLDREMARQFN
jgi:hypothetical protein